jgi:hypothetical protein
MSTDLDLDPTWAEKAADEIVRRASGHAFSTHKALCDLVSYSVALELRQVRSALARHHPLPPTPPDWLRALYEEVEAAWTVAADTALGRTEKARRETALQVLLDLAGQLDGRGLTSEANVLRDAASIIEDEFK